MSYRRIQWLAVLLPAAILGLWESVRHTLLERLLPGVLGNLVGALVVAAAAYGFVQMFIRLVEGSAREAAMAREQAAVMRERQRIAREMHDGVAQALFYLNVKLGEMERLLTEGQVAVAAQRLGAVRSHLEETNRRVRGVIQDLNQVDDEPLGDALRRQIARHMAAGGAHVQMDVHGETTVAGPVREHLLAIVQEALVNADKHGGGTRVHVQAELQPGQVRLRVSDNGRGFTAPLPAPGGGHGLAIMTERARLAGGRLQVTSAVGQGTVVEVMVP